MAVVVGPGEALVANGVGGFLADHLISQISDTGIAQMLKDKDTLGRDADIAIEVVIAQYLYTHPQSGVIPKIKLDDPRFPPPLDEDGNLRVPQTEAENEAFKRWLGQTGRFEGLVQQYREQVSHELAAEIVLGE